MNSYPLSKRTYSDIYNELKKKYPNKPDWVFVELARLYALKSDLTNIIANDIINPKTRRSAYMFAKKRSYEPVESDGATTSLTLTLKETMSKTLGKGYKVGGQSSVSGKFVYYELTSDASSGGTGSIAAQAKQKITHTQVNLGTIESNDDFLEFPLDGYSGIIKNSLSIWIDGVKWSRIDYLYEAEPSDKVFSVSYDDKGLLWLKFGDGVSGAKPDIQSVVTGSFECTEGLDGRVEAGDLTYNAGGDSDIISLTCTASSGGNDPESVAAIKRNAVKTYRLRDAVFTLEDCEQAALQASSNVVKAFAIRGDQTLTIYVVGAGGGEISADELTTISEYVQSYTAFEDETVLIYNALIQNQNIVGVAYPRSGYNGETIAQYVRFALFLASCPYDIQILDKYADSGVSVTRELINTLDEFDFSDDDEDAIKYIITKWEELLGDNPYRDWGQALSEGDLYALVKGLVPYGLQKFIMSNPTGDIDCATSSYIINGVVTVTAGE